MLSVVLPSWGRKELTLQMLASISLQTLKDFELFFIGDACPVFEEIIEADDFKFIKNALGKRMIAFNMPDHDGTSAQAINYAMKNCSGDYFMFLSNDDIIFPDHFENYHNMTASSGKDFAIFNTCINYGDGILYPRNPVLAPTKIGHSELCISNHMTKNLPPHSRLYGHDWEFIEKALNAGYKCHQANNNPTYIVNLARREHNWEGNRLI